MLGIELVERSIQHIINDVKQISLTGKMREVSDNVASYIALSSRNFVKGVVRNDSLTNTPLVVYIKNYYCIRV